MVASSLASSLSRRRGLPRMKPVRHGDGTSVSSGATHQMCRALLRIVVVSLALRAAPAAAFHYITPTLVQIPPVNQNPGAIHNPHWGGLRYVLFDSDADLLNNGSTGRHIFLFDLQLRDVLGSPALTQLSAGSIEDNQRPHTGRRAILIASD